MLTWILLAFASQQTAVLLHDAEQSALHNDLKGSEALLRRAIVSIDQNDADPKPTKAMVLRNLAGVLRKQGRHADALEAARQSLELVEARFGSDDILLVPVLNTLAEIQMERGYFNAAHHQLLRAMALGPDAGAHYATTLFDLGALHSKLGDGKRASQYYRQCFEVRVRLLGRSHPHTLLAESSLVRLARK
jgi:tetratricopeptide (TPR) repeat protein